MSFPTLLRISGVKRLVQDSTGFGEECQARSSLLGLRALLVRVGGVWCAWPQPLAFNELSDPASHHGHHLQQISVRGPHLGAEGFENSDGLTTYDDRKAETSMKSGLDRRCGSREVVILCDVVHPRRFARFPRVTGKTFPICAWGGANLFDEC